LAPRVLALVGHTASGKSEAAFALGRSLGAEVVSVDSMLVYEGMDVGTAKPTPEQRSEVPHHMIDLIEPSERFSVAEYQRLGRISIDEIRSRGKRPLLVGGSGLYYRALVDDLAFPGTDPEIRAELESEAALVGAESLHGRLMGFDPAAAVKIEPGNARRTIRALEVAALTGAEFSTFSAEWENYPVDRVHAAGLTVAPDALDARVRARVDSMMAAGFLEEVEGLLARGLGRWITSSQAIGYMELARHIEGEMSLAEAAERTVRRTKNLARRQSAWFRRDPRIKWFEVGTAGPGPILDELRRYLEAA
jgi:tRNA dimethylallyltransferase